MTRPRSYGTHGNGSHNGLTHVCEDAPTVLSPILGRLDR